MPTLGAMLVASLAGYLVDLPVRALLGPVPSIAASLIVSTVAFYVARRILSNLRDGT